MSEYNIEDFIGGFPPKLFEHPDIIEHIKSGNAANGGGYIGRWQERNDWRDKCTYDELYNLKLGEDFIVMFLTSRLGRWYAESFNNDPYYDNKEYGKTNKFLYFIGLCVQEGVLKCEYNKEIQIKNN